MEILPLVGLGLLIAGLGAYAWPHVAGPWRESAAWRALAMRTGLTYRPRTALGVPRRGRLSGTYRGRALTLTVRKRLGSLYMRVVLPLRCPTYGMRLVLAPSAEARASAQPLAVLHSQPPDLGARVLAALALGERWAPVVQGLRRYHCRIEVSEHMLLFEETPRSWYWQGFQCDVDALYALLDALCDLAEAAEGVEG